MTGQVESSTKQDKMEESSLINKRLIRFLKLSSIHGTISPGGLRPISRDPNLIFSLRFKRSQTDNPPFQFFDLSFPYLSFAKLIILTILDYKNHAKLQFLNILKKEENIYT